MNVKLCMLLLCGSVSTIYASLPLCPTVLSFHDMPDTKKYILVTPEELEPISKELALPEGLAVTVADVYTWLKEGMIIGGKQEIDNIPSCEKYGYPYKIIDYHKSILGTIAYKASAELKKSNNQLLKEENWKEIQDISTSMKEALACITLNEYEHSGCKEENMSFDYMHASFDFLIRYTNSFKKWYGYDVYDGIRRNRFFYIDYGVRNIFDHHYTRISSEYGWAVPENLKTRLAFLKTYVNFCPQVDWKRVVKLLTAPTSYVDQKTQRALHKTISSWYASFHMNEQDATVHTEKIVKDATAVMETTLQKMHTDTFNGLAPEILKTLQARLQKDYDTSCATPAEDFFNTYSDLSLSDTITTVCDLFKINDEGDEKITIDVPVDESEIDKLYIKRLALLLRILQMKQKKTYKEFSSEYNYDDVLKNVSSKLSLSQYTSYNFLKMQSLYSYRIDWQDVVTRLNAMKLMTPKFFDKDYFAVILQNINQLISRSFDEESSYQNDTSLQLLCGDAKTFDEAWEYTAKNENGIRTKIRKIITELQSVTS